MDGKCEIWKTLLFFWNAVHKLTNISNLTQLFANIVETMRLLKIKIQFLIGFKE